jgi:hypothetical protein
MLSSIPSSLDLSKIDIICPGHVTCQGHVFEEDIFPCAQKCQMSGYAANFKYVDKK